MYVNLYIYNMKVVTFLTFRHEQPLKAAASLEEKLMCISSPLVNNAHP